MKNTKLKIFNGMAYGGYVILAVAIVLPFFMGPQSSLYKYIFAVGATIMLIGRLFQPNNETVFRARRLVRLEKWVPIFFCVSAFFMFYSKDPRDWLAFTLAGAVIQILVGILLPRARK